MVLPGNLVPQWLCWDDCNFLYNTFICMEIQCKSSVVLFNNDLRGLLDRLGSDTTLKIKEWKNLIKTKLNFVFIHRQLSKCARGACK